MPFANIKVPEAALSRAQKEEIVHKVTNLFVDYFSEAVRPHTMVLIEEVKDGGYARADEVFVIPDAYRVEGLIAGGPPRGAAAQTSGVTGSCCKNRGAGGKSAALVSHDGAKGEIS